MPLPGKRQSPFERLLGGGEVKKNKKGNPHGRLPVEDRIFSIACETD
jgi:hypothetical protein